MPDKKGEGAEVAEMRPVFKNEQLSAETGFHFHHFIGICYGQKYC